MKNFLLLSLLCFSLFAGGCGSSGVLTRVTGSSSGVDAKTAYYDVAAVFTANNFSVSGDSINFAGLIADYKTPWTYSIQGDGEGFSKKVFTLGMEVKVDISAHSGGGLELVLTPFYWQAEDLSDFDKKLNAIADRVNSSLNKEALKKRDPVSAFPNASPLRYYKEDDRESGTLTPDDTKVYKNMIIVFTKTVDEISARLGISKDHLKFEIKQ